MWTIRPPDMYISGGSVLIGRAIGEGIEIFDGAVSVVPEEFDEGCKTLAKAFYEGKGDEHQTQPLAVEINNELHIFCFTEDDAVQCALHIGVCTKTRKEGVIYPGPGGFKGIFGGQVWRSLADHQTMSSGRR